jgi:glucose/arabinose dehydrogenase
VGQSGPIWEIGPGGHHSPPLLNLTGRISTGSEQGVLGLAFHPAFADNGRFFVFFTQPNGDIMIQEFEDDGSWPIDPDSGLDVIEIEHGDATNHNGGALAFGADGYLYASIGDGGIRSWVARGPMRSGPMG